MQCRMWGRVEGEMVQSFWGGRGVEVSFGEEGGDGEGVGMEACGG